MSSINIYNDSNRRVIVYNDEMVFSAEVHGRTKRREGEGRPRESRYWGTEANIMRSAERETSRNELLSNANETRVLVTERSDSEMRMYISEQ